jgi:Carboxypeptidase regulatory-like domain/TonB dependent receptor
MRLVNPLASGEAGVRAPGFLSKLAAAVCLVLFATSLTFAQTAKGTIQGTVKDPNGAAVVGATVEAANDATGDKRTATTNDDGVYTLTNLDVGTYTISVSGTGFAAATVKGVQVSVSFTQTQDVQLALAGASETVTVASGDAQTTVNTTDQQLSTLITQQKIQDLPLLSRDPNSLLLLAPGTNQSSSRLGGFTVNGQRERNNNFLVDGIDNNDADVPGIPGGISTPNIDATQEFRVITNNFNAEFGRNSGAIVNVATRSGTNQFHGAGYIYYRSDAFAARNFFDTTGKPNPLQRRQPGFSIGGPARKDKTFFFFNYEHDQFDQGITVTQTVPTAAARQGIFDLRSAGFGVINASTQASTSNRFGLAINPNLVALLNTFVPLPNTPGEAQPLPGVFELFRFGTQTNDKQSQISTRVDHRINDKHTLTGSYALSDGTFEFCCETFPGLNDAIQSPQTTHRLSLNLVSTLSPNVVNELRFGGNRSKLTFAGPGDFGVNAASYEATATALQRSGVGVDGQTFGGTNGGLINFGIAGIVSPFAAFDTQFRHTGTTQIGDSLTLIHGNHTFKTGGEVRWVYSNGASNFNRSEFLNFSAPTNLGVNLLLNQAGNATLGTGGIRGTVQNFFSYLTGTVYSQTQSQFFNKNGQRTDADYRGYRQREFEVFAQDTWKIKSNLTLNYGIRYAFYGVPFEVNGQMSTLVNQDPSGFTPDGGFVFELVGKNSGGRTKLYDDDLNNIAPRVGFAYSPDFKSGWMSKLTGGPGNMSIRGGYGIFYDRVFGNLFSNSSANPPFQRDLFNSPGLDCLNAGTCGSAGAIAASRLANFGGRPATLDPTNVAVDGDFIFPVIFAQAGNNQLQNKFAMPYTQAWNFGFQRQFKGNMLFEADYVGSKSTNLLRVIDGQMTSVDRVNAILGLTPAENPIDPNNPTLNFLDGVLNFAFFQVGTNVSIGQSNYNAGQFRITKNLTNSRWGLGQIQAAYTYSHSIDNAPDPIDAQAGERSFPRDSSGFAGGLGAERGNSGFDVRHRFVGNMVYELPFRFDNSVAKAALGNWTISGIWTWQSGSPYTIFGFTDSAGTGLGQRANFLGGDINARSSGEQTQTGPDVTLFGTPLPCNTCSIQARQGSTGRNAFYGPSYNNTDFSLIKRFPFGGEGRYRFTVRADFFNLFNHTNFAKPVNTISSANFGFSTDTFASRRIQFVGRFDF